MNGRTVQWSTERLLGRATGSLDTDLDMVEKKWKSTRTLEVFEVCAKNSEGLGSVGLGIKFVGPTQTPSLRLIIYCGMLHLPKVRNATAKPLCANAVVLIG